MLLLQVQDTVDVDGDVVLGDGGLLGDVDGDFLEALDVLDLINQRDQEVQTGVEDCVVSSHPLNNLQWSFSFDNLVLSSKV